jgi:hypothetical protein
VTHAVNTAYESTDPYIRATADCGVIGYFFLLRPGEHTYCSTENHPFRLEDVSFFCANQWRNAAVTPLTMLNSSTQVLLNFTTQKNGEENEAISHGDTPAPLVSPLKAVLRRVVHLRTNQAPPSTPLHQVYLPAGKPRHVSAGALTNLLRESCSKIGASLGISSGDISARALRAGGAMALLRAGVDPTVIQMVGRWKSWVMIQYLHKSATQTTDLAARMMTGGLFAITAHQFLPADAVALLASVEGAAVA